jgi:hypothetical protein
MAVCLSARAVVASLAGAAFGWWRVAVLGLVVVEQRGGRVVEFACLVVGEPGGATVGRVGEDRHAVVVGDGWCARAVALRLCGIPLSELAPSLGLAAKCRIRVAGSSGRRLWVLAPPSFAFCDGVEGQPYASAAPAHWGPAGQHGGTAPNASPYGWLTRVV